MNRENQSTSSAYLLLGAIQALLIMPIAAHADTNVTKTTIDDNPYTQTAETPTSAETPKLDKRALPECSGLDRDYWTGWRNNYTKSQFKRLLKNSIAANIKEADQILAAQGDLFEDSYMEYLYAAVLVNQLTINLSERPDLPNPTKAELNRACRLVAGCESAGRKRFVQGCGSVNFDFKCDLGYWVDLGREISSAHQKSGCAGGAELFECSQMAFEADYLFGEIEVASCVLSRFAKQEIGPWESLPHNPY